MPRSEWSAPVTTTTPDSGPQSGRSGWSAPITTTTPLGGGRSGWSEPVTTTLPAPVFRIPKGDGTAPFYYLLLKTDTGLVPGWPLPPVGTPLPVLTVSNFQPVAPTTTGAVFTFQTPDNVPVTRIMEYRVVGTTAWTTFKLPVIRVGSHTAGYTGLTVGTAYEARMTLSADGFQPVVLTAALGGTYASLNFTTATTTTPVPTLPRLRLSPPTLVDPLTIEVPVAGGSYRGLNGRDVRWVLPLAVMTGQLSIYGGRHHHIIGGEVRMTSSGTAFDLEQWTGDMYVEGVVADPTGVGPLTGTYPPGVERPTAPPYYGDAFRPNSSAAGARFILQNAYVQVDGFAKYADGTNGPHGDMIQCYTGPSSLLVDKASCDTYYQGGFILPQQQGTPPPSYGPYRARDVDVHRHASSGGAGAWTLGSGPTDVVYTNCYARRDAGSNTNLVSGLAAASWTVGTDPLPVRNCPRSSVGVGYTSPGYV